MNLHDVVRLKKDRDECGLKSGAIGTIVAIFDQPQRAFEVEFANGAGQTIAEIALREDEIEPVNA